MLKGTTYEEICDIFQWKIPATFNVGVQVCDKWCQQGKGDEPALIHVDKDLVARTFRFRDLKELSGRLANLLAAHGMGKGDRVGIFLPQCPETLISHIAVYKMGGVALPLLTLFGETAIEYRLSDSGASAVITNRQNLPKILSVKDRLEKLKLVVVTDGHEAGCMNWEKGLQKASPDFTPVVTGPDDPAVIIYTSGTTGQPKGTVHGHRILLGIAPGFSFFHNRFPQKNDRMYTPLDWAYIGGSYDAIFPSLYFGVCVLAFRPGKFDPEQTLRVMGKHRAKKLMAVPTVLRLMKGAVPNPRNKYQVSLRSVTVGGETLGDELYDWSRTSLGAEINEHYGQTECDMVVGGCHAVMGMRKGFIGKAAPGHTVEIIDEAGGIMKPGEIGEIAIKSPDPVMFLKYENRPKETAEKYLGHWFKTGDFGQKDDQGYFRFEGRRDDIIESGGFRIGPGEIEECLMTHEAVSLVCVLGVPDKTRGEVVKAYIVPQKGFALDERLENSIRDHVKTRLEAHAYPRKIQFLTEMPMTSSGKIRKDKLRQMNGEGDN